MSRFDDMKRDYLEAVNQVRASFGMNPTDNASDGINYSDEPSNLDLDKISRVAEQSVEKYMTAYLDKTSTVFKCDIDYFYNYAKRKFFTIQDWKKYDWSKKYLNSKFNVNVEAKVYYSLLHSD